ncbi:hypothetical protein Kpol_1011p4 [Vanderwaltozyma polyspora DSM 70294]|uniref:Proteasome activator BLM10 n=1 Tax=Vanderwaltozyma polyspora (strain ATCC 22028 / DSM 70294 / BCRC 21397 / CBS 2163 / NBRC 10782 / NRRL Y-8283 / UCD 57-17) TaxID=436907 RepID=A7TQW1_VANPO|nr:uncharacterized protein Kpol_1011p4 [Vanderwaltozyma polyspora DSM 70294]EDO15334.1 hypothetical protein Kpol_1011p4 [Vanderwaltozyma polyspora DSM 70294]
MSFSVDVSEGLISNKDEEMKFQDPVDRAQKTPSPVRAGFLSDMNSENIIDEMAKFYGLDYNPDAEVHMKEIYDPNSKWFCRPNKPLFPIEECLPYKTETHLEQAKYLCHVLTNLYVAIGSRDIQGLIPISEKDLMDFKKEVVDFSQDLDLTKITSEINEAEVLNSDIANFDEGEGEDEELFEENEYVDFSGPDFNATGKITSKSAATVNVNYWTNELKNFMHLELPLSLRKSLASVYYYLSLVQGQKIYRQMHVEMFELLVTKDDDDTNFTNLLLSIGLELDHKILLDFLFEFLPYPDSDFVRHDILAKEDLQLFRLLLKLAHQAKPFFAEHDEELLKNLMDRFLSYIAPSTMVTIMPMITSFVPYHYHDNSKITDYFPFFYSLWSSVSANVAIDTHMYDFVGNVSEDAHSKILSKNYPFIKLINFGDYGLFTDDQLTFMFNRLQGHLRSDGQIHSYSRTVRPFVFAINGSTHEMFFKKLVSLIKSIETFVHPSNSGFWTKPISKFIHGFIKMYHGRAKDEQAATREGKSDPMFLNEKCHSRMVEIFLDLLITGSQNKSSDVANYYISSFAYLLELSPLNSNLVFDKILGDLYEALSGEYINSRHRIISSLKQFTRVVRFIVMDKLYRVHVTNILSILVSKIDMNDINLSSNIINGIVSVATFVPFTKLVSDDEYLTFESYTLPFIEQHYYHMKSNVPNTTFEYDEQTLDNAFRASTTIFKNILREYIDKIFQLISVDLEEGFVSKLNNTSMIMQESMDNEIFTFYAKRLQECFWNNDSFGDSNPNFELVTIPLAATVRRNSSCSKKLFSELKYNINIQIERGAGSIRSTSEIHPRDFKLVFYLTALNDMLRQSHSAILEYKDDLLEFMKFIYENITNPPLDVITSIICHSAIASLTNTEIINCSMYSDSCPLDPKDRWGGLQFDNNKFKKENLDFKWYEPTNAEVTTAIYFLEDISKHCQKRINELVDSNNTGNHFVDKIQKYVLIMTHALSGTSLLFDPDFHRNESFSPNELTEKEMSLLMKNSNFDEIDPNKLTLGNGLLVDEVLDVNCKGNQPSNGKIKGRKRKNSLHDEMLIDNIKSFKKQIITNGKPEITSNTNNGHFWELDIYCSNYFFGNTLEEKFSSPNYFKVHKIRNDIGLYFHKLFSILSSNFENYTMVFQILLHGLKVWFSDIGKEIIFGDDPTAKLDLEFLENIQSLSNLSEPYTRTCLAMKADSFHQGRVLLHSVNRKPSKLEISLLKDIILLATSVYPDIHKPAQGTLVHCMKSIVGSYSIIINEVIELLTEALKAHDHMRLEAILKVTMIKKVHRRIMTDYRNLERLTMLLIECCRINELDIAIYGDRILGDIADSLKIPSNICLMEDKIISTLAPVDAEINKQVSIVKQTKNKKRELFISLLYQLSNNLISMLENEKQVNWKISIFMIRFITRIQSNFETSSNKESVKAIFEQTKSKHPQIIQLSVKSLLGIFNKLFSLSDYGYNLEKAYERNFDPVYIENLETSDDNYKSQFVKEMNNFTSPSYFIDSRVFIGWLCWGTKMKVVKPVPIEINLEKNELEILACFGQLVKKEWLKELTSNFIQDNETRSVFSSSNVSFVILLVYLCSKQLSDFKLEDIFELCEKTYDRYDKASMILSMEIFSALICSSKYMSKEMLDKRNAFVKRFMYDCLNNELNHDAIEIWVTICWWLPTVVDLRRCPEFFEVFYNIENILNTNTDSISNKVSKLSMLRNVLVGMEFKSPDFIKNLDSFIFDHPSEQIREIIAKVFTTVIQNCSYPSLPNSKTVMDIQQKNPDGMGVPIKIMPKEIESYLKEQFSRVTEEAKNIIDLSAQEILKSKYYYISSTMYCWVREMLKGPNKMLLIPFLARYVVPFLVGLIKQKDVCKISGLMPSKLYVELAYLPIPKKYIQEVVDMICDETMMTSSNQIQLQLSLLQHFLSSQLLQLTESQKDKILQFVVNNLYHTQFIEVRVRSSEVLSDIVHNLGTTGKMIELIEKFDDNLGKFSWEERKALSKIDTKVHGSVVGLGAIISAFPYVFPLPSWIPKQLCHLASWARTGGMAGTAAKNTISEFKKVRTDTWQFDRQSFTSEELEDLEGVLWRSYYV